MESSPATQAYRRWSNQRFIGALGARRDPNRAGSRGAVLAKLLLRGDLAVAFLAGGTAALLFGMGGAIGLTYALAAALLWPASAFTFGLYRGDELANWASSLPDLPRFFFALLAVSWPLFGLAVVLGDGPAVGLAFATAAAIAPLGIFARTAVRARLQRNPEYLQRTVILGSGVVAGDIVKKLRNNPQFGLAPIGLVDDEVHDVGEEDLPWLGRFSDLDEVIDEHGVDRVIIAFSRAGLAETLASIRVCRDAGVAIDVVPRLFEVLDGVPSLNQLGGLPLLSIGPARMTKGSLVAKRLLDVVVSSVALIVLSPVLLAIAAAVKLESKGPVLFRQPRAGRNRARFELVKFRSMYGDADRRKQEFEALNDIDDGVMFKIRDDPRVTRVGKLIRRFSLDELPQLFNVLRGDMSLVGPRPLIFPETDALAEDWHMRRLELRPGITGPWQVYGRSQNPFQEMVRFDYQYVAGWSLARDVEILFQTVPAVLSGRGAY